MGAFDVGAVIEDDGLSEGTASNLLTLAEALGRGRFGRDANGWWAAAGPIPGIGERTLAHLPADVGASLIRARDGWVLMAAPDRETFRAISMTFLRKHFYFEHSERTAWRSAAVNELATLVVGTHRAEDVEGTSETYGIPCLCLRSWLDEVQSSGEKAGLEATRSSQLAGLLHYGALVSEGGRRRGEDALGHLRRRIIEAGAGDFSLAPDLPTP